MCWPEWKEVNFYKSFYTPHRWKNLSGNNGKNQSLWRRGGLLKDNGGNCAMGKRIGRIDYIGEKYENFNITL